MITLCGQLHKKNTFICMIKEVFEREKEKEGGGKAREKGKILLNTLSSTFPLPLSPPQGMELHCLKKHVEPRRLQFLPYHFLLVSVGERGQLVYQDTSTGGMVFNAPTKMGTFVDFSHPLFYLNIYLISTSPLYNYIYLIIYTVAIVWNKILAQLLSIWGTLMGLSLFGPLITVLLL